MLYSFKHDEHPIARRTAAGRYREPCSSVAETIDRAAAAAADDDDAEHGPGMALKVSRLGGHADDDDHHADVPDDRDRHGRRHLRPQVIWRRVVTRRTCEATAAAAQIGQLTGQERAYSRYYY